MGPQVNGQHEFSQRVEFPANLHATIYKGVSANSTKSPYDHLGPVVSRPFNRTEYGDP